MDGWMDGRSMGMCVPWGGGFLGSRLIGEVLERMHDR